MHLLLTDRLSCPRCGPEFGLILLADRMEDRYVVDGVLGCPNCRDSFPIVDGFGDLRAPPRREPPSGRAGEPGPAEPEEALRVAALLGLAGGPGTVALVGEPARLAEAVSLTVESVDFVAVDPDLRSWPPRPRVSRLMCGPGLPFFSRTLRGVAVDGRLGDSWIREACRVVAAKCRVLVVHAEAGAAESARSAGLTVLAEEPETVVAARS